MATTQARGILQSVGIANILRCSKRVDDARRAMVEREAELNAAVSTHLAAIGGSLRQQAALLGFSAPYVHDVRNGRRQASKEFILRLQEYAEGKRPLRSKAKARAR